MGLTTLFVRRKRGDLIETYKILTCWSSAPAIHHFMIDLWRVTMQLRIIEEKIEKVQFFELSNNGCFLRGHTMKLIVSRPRLDIRKYSFSQRVVAEWNRLPEHIVTAPSDNAFKNRLDDHRRDMGI